MLLVVTDDQPYGMSRHLPFLSGRTDFTEFSEAHANTSMCCPARATLLTGLYSHHTQVEDNYQGWRFDASSTLATWLDSAGYETGLFGKYLNRYPWNRGESYIPPGWDEWAAYSGGAEYYRYTLNENGTPVHYGNAAADYATDVLRDKALQFVDQAPEPFFAYFAPYGAHLPFTPAPRHSGISDDLAVALPPNFNQVSAGASLWWRKRERMTQRSAIGAFRDQVDALLSVDEAFRALMDKLAERGVADRTLVVFLSDNGYSYGSHRWGGGAPLAKGCAYEECGHIPLHVRLPGGSPLARISTPVSNVDVAPTIAALAGVGGATDGRSLVPLLTGERTSLHRPILLRGHRPGGKLGYPPSYWGIRTERWKYIVEHDRGRVGRDLFDLRRDPYELRDLAGRRELRDTRARLRQRMRALRAGS